MSDARPLHERLAVLFIDVQAGFVEAARGTLVLARIVRLARIARWLGLPTMATVEEPLAQKGALAPALEEALTDGTTVASKWPFDAFREDGFGSAVRSLDRPVLAVAGFETDVCVLQTVEGALAARYEVLLVEDCVASAAADATPALARMRAVGAVSTTLRSLAFELTATADRRAWPPTWRRRLEAEPDLFPAEDDLTADF
jgi:nicotinamidase-related amidase